MPGKPTKKEIITEVVKNREAINVLNTQCEQLRIAVNKISKTTMELVVLFNVLLRKGVITDEEVHHEQGILAAEIAKRQADQSVNSNTDQGAAKGCGIQSPFPRADASDCKRS